jgi:hypothetical protein
MKHVARHEEGISSVGILVALLILVTLGLGGFSLYSYSAYRDQKDNVDAKINTAVVSAKKQQADADNADFAQRAKLPNTTFDGPSDLGSVHFAYPKTWSVYIGDGADTTNGSTYTVYLNPGSVPTISNQQQFALHLKIENQTYATVLGNYESIVKSGKLKSSIVTTNGLTGTRLDGAFSSGITGSAAIFKVRDKTLTIQTDSPTYVADFNNTVLPSLTFTP